MKCLRTLILCLALIVLLGGLCRADVPRIIYDGAAIDTAGRVVGAGPQKIEFRVYATPSGGKPIWREVIPAAQVEQGRFRAELGRINSLNLDLNRDYYISLKFGSGPEGARRQKIYRSTDPRKAEALGGDLAYIVADGPPGEIIGQTGCDMNIHPGGNWGAEIGIWRNVVANSNGNDTGGWSSLEPYCQDGYRYQCVEYPRRFYRLAMGMDTSQWFANGNQFYTKGPIWGLNRYANDATSLPQADDILCMDGSTYGHVAIVKRASSTSVDIVQQNCSTTTAYQTLSVSNGIVQAWSVLYVQGWLRKPGYVPAPSTPMLVSPANEAFAAYGTSVTLTAQAGPEGPTPDSYYFTLTNSSGTPISNSGWISGTTSASYNVPVQPGNRYLWTAKARANGAESPQATASAFWVNLPPNATTLISPMNGEWSPTSTVTLSWNAAADPLPGPSAVEYRLTVKRLSNGFTDVYYPVATTSKQLFISVTGPFAWKVDCSDGLDFSPVSEERRFVVDTAIPTVESLGHLKSNADGGSAVACGPVTVTAGLDKFAGVFYVEESDQSSGLAVCYDASGGPSVVAGDLLNLVKGTLDTSNSERVLQSALVSGIAHGAEIPHAILIGSRHLGGAGLGDWTPGVFGGIGVNNIGLLATICGNVTNRDPSGAYFYVDDGGSVKDGSGQTGVRVSCTGLASENVITPPEQGTFAIVTGISSTAQVAGYNVRCLRPRSQSDILPRP